MEGKPGRGQPLTNKRSAPAYFDAASSRFNQQAKGGSTVLAKISCIIFSKVAPLHIVMAKGKSFHWSKQHQKSFDYFERIISQAPVPAMPNLQQPFQNRH